MKCRMTGNKKRLRRREVLSASATVAGFSALGVTSISEVSAEKKGDALGETLLSEVLLTHETELSSPITHNDGVAPYKVDPSEGDVLLHDFVPASTIDSLTNDDAVVKKNAESWDDVFETPSETLYGQTSEYAKLDGGSALILAEEYTSPSVEVVQSGQDVTVSTSGKSVTVTAGTEEKLELPEQPVTVNKPSGKTETANIRPVIVARNFGKQTVRKLEGGN